LVLRPGRYGVSPAEQVPSDDWAPVEHLWEDVAQAWFKPEGERATYLFRVPRERFPPADTGPPLTIETLLEAASIPKDEVESWHLGDTPPSGEGGTSPELGQPLPPPPPETTHLTVYVQVRPSAPAAVRGDGEDSEVPPEKWQALDALWRAVLGLEAAIDALRLSMDGLRAEMEAAFKRSMTVEDKVHALQADVVQWTKAKSRVHYALPKVREFVHRATWASATPERKAMEEVVETYIEPRVPPPDLNHVRERLEHLQKDRQVLFGQGNAVGQECRNILAEIQRAFSTLQRNAADRARKEREARRTKGKYL
jgi:hypothetical protein